VASSTGSPTLSALGSVILNTAGLAILRGTRPGDLRGKVDRLPCALFGVFGLLLHYAGLVFSITPWLLVSDQADEGKLAAILNSTLVLSCWFIERLQSKGQGMNPLHGCGCAVVWFGSTLIEWAGPRPYDSMMAGLSSQVAGCDGGYRSPFLIYAAVWLTSTLFGALFLCCAKPGSGSKVSSNSTSSEEDEQSVSRTSRELEKLEEFRNEWVLRRKVLPFIYGFAISMSCLVFASGVARDVMGWVLFGAALLGIAAACSWQWLWYLELPLCLWALVSQSASSILRLTQSHLVFRSFRWSSTTERGLLVVWQWPGVWFFLLGVFLIACVMALHITSQVEPRDGEDQAPRESQLEMKDDESSCTGPRLAIGAVQFILLIMTMYLYFIGITRPLMSTHFETPEVLGA